jgi:hypothetical protein
MTTSEKLMDASQKLAKLSERAKEAEDHASAAQNQAKADVERSANEARARAEAHAEELHQSAAATGAQISASWNDLQKSWGNHMAQVRQGIDDKKASSTPGGRRRALTMPRPTHCLRSTTPTGRLKKRSTRCSMRSRRGWKPKIGRWPRSRTARAG